MEKMTLKALIEAASASDTDAGKAFVEGVKEAQTYGCSLKNSIAWQYICRRDEPVFIPRDTDGLVIIKFNDGSFYMYRNPLADFVDPEFIDDFDCFGRIYKDLGDLIERLGPLEYCRNEVLQFLGIALCEWCGRIKAWDEYAHCEECRSILEPLFFGECDED